MNSKTDKKELFTKDNIAVECPEKMVWDKMEVVGEGKRLCEGCDKVLVDVTGYTKEEVHALQKKDPTICVAVTNALLVSSLSFSLLSAGGEMEPIDTTAPIETNTSNGMFNETVVGIVDMPISIKPPVIADVVPPVVLGLPVFPPEPMCGEGTEELDIVGFEDAIVCVEKEDEE